MRWNTLRAYLLPRRFCIKAAFILILLATLYTVAGYVFTLAANRTNRDILNEYNFTQYTVAPTTFNLNKIREIITKINQEEKVYNEDIFGPIKEVSVVIVVQVHNRLEYLRYLIDSLSAAKEISTALLIFSHDVFNEEINRLIYSIKFCKVIQIFCPYSIQLHPNEFPGIDPRDCPINTPFDEAAKETPCLNYFYVDQFNQRRIPELVQIKHHWWWKAHKVFTLKALKAYNGFVLFLEEDQFVVKDFIPVLRLMVTQTKQKDAASCKFISLSAESQAVGFSAIHFQQRTTVEVRNQLSNVALSFTRKTWNEILDCRELFCLRDDYNWDFSLKYVLKDCLEDTKAMVLISPRVFHLGACGVHSKSEACNISKQLTDLRKVLTTYQNLYYPEKLFVIYRFEPQETDIEYGGWGDPRDQDLCLNMTEEFQKPITTL